MQQQTAHLAGDQRVKFFTGRLWSHLFGRTSGRRRPTAGHRAGRLASLILSGVFALSGASASLAQTTLLSETLRTGSCPSGWTGVTITWTTAASGYARFTATSSTLTTPSFNASAHASVDVELSVAKYGSGTDGPITVEYSLDGGTSWNTAGNSGTPTGTTYVNSKVTINSVSANMKVRFNRVNSPSEKRLRDVVIKGIGSAPSCPSYWHTLYNRGTPHATYYLGDKLTNQFEFAVNQDTTGWTVDYGLGTNTSGSGWTWRTADWSREVGSDRYWKAKQNEHQFDSVGNWYYAGQFIQGSCIYYADADREATTGGGLSATNYFLVNALNNPGNQSATAAGTSQINLSWSRWNPGSGSKSVLIVRKAGSAVTWSPTQGTGYTDGQDVGGGHTVLRGSLGADSLSDTGLSAGTTYYYKIYSENWGYYSAGVTASVITVCAAPATPTASSVTSSGFTVNWSATTGAASYRLDVATDSSFTTFVSGYNDLTVSGTSQAITGLSASTTYYVRIRAVNAGGTSANSGTLTQATAAP